MEFASELIFGQDRGMMTSELKSRELFAARRAVGYYGLFVGSRHLRVKVLVESTISMPQVNTSERSHQIVYFHVFPIVSILYLYISTLCIPLSILSFAVVVVSSRNVRIDSHIIP